MNQNHRTTRRILSIGLAIAFLISSCTQPEISPQPPTEQQPSITITFTPTITATPTATEPTTASEPCGYRWARHRLATGTDYLQDQLNRSGIQFLDAYLEAYGEDCVRADGSIASFATMETDFYVQLQVEDLQDAIALADLLGQVMQIILDTPDELTPGPIDGYAGITFTAGEESARLWFTLRRWIEGRDNGLQGSQMLDWLENE